MTIFLYLTNESEKDDLTIKRPFGYCLPEPPPGFPGLQRFSDVLVFGGFLALVFPDLGVPDGHHAVRALDLRPLVVFSVVFPHQFQVVDLEVADSTGPRVKLLLVSVPLRRGSTLYFANPTPPDLKLCLT